MDEGPRSFRPSGMEASVDEAMQKKILPAYGRVLSHTIVKELRNLPIYKG